MAAVTRPPLKIQGDEIPIPKRNETHKCAKCGESGELRVYTAMEQGTRKWFTVILHKNGKKHRQRHLTKAAYDRLKDLSKKQAIQRPYRSIYSNPTMVHCKICGEKGRLAAYKITKNGEKLYMTAAVHINPDHSSRKHLLEEITKEEYAAKKIELGQRDRTLPAQP